MHTLTNLKLTNFRIHRSTNIDITSNFFALVGKNDIGKSSILEALDILCNREKNISEDDTTKGSSIPANIVGVFDGQIYDYSKRDSYDKSIINMPFFYKFDVDNNNHFIDLEQGLHSLIDLCHQECEIFIEITYPYHFERIKVEKLINFFINLYNLNIETKSQTIKDFINDFMYGNRDLQKIIAKKQLFYSNSTNPIEQKYIKNIFSILSQFEPNIQEVLNCKGLTNKAKQLIKEFENSGDTSLLYNIKEIQFEKYNQDLESFISLMDKPYYLTVIPDGKTESEWVDFKDIIDFTYLNGRPQINDIQFFNENENRDLCDLIFEGSLEDILTNSNEIFARFDKYAALEEETDIVYLWDKYLYSFGSNDIKLGQRGSGFKRLCEIYYFTMSNLAQYRGFNSSTILAIEEPEISLHPSQQRDIVQRLRDILNLPYTQVIISTHSPYIVNELDEKSITILKRKKDSNGNELDEIDPNPLKDRLLNHYLCEINYLAFEEASYDYHVALFGLMQNLINTKLGFCDVEHVDKNCLKNEPFKSLTSFHTYFRTGKNEQLIEKTSDKNETDPLKKYVHEEHSLQYCVRNYIDHPHDMNRAFGEMKMVDTSIKQMFNIIAELKKLPDLPSK